MAVPELPGRTQLTVVSGEPDCELRHIARIVSHSVIVRGGAELEQLLERWLDEAERCAAIAARTLDLIGHTRGPASLLTLGSWTLDLADPATTTLFHRIAHRDLLPRLGVRGVRLLGCNSAVTPRGRATIVELARVLGLEVHGAKQLLHAGHYDAGGFRDCWRFLLASASDLERDAHPSALAVDPRPRVLDLAALPAVVLGSFAARWPRRFVPPQAARAILQLVRRREGARLLDTTAPTWELALPTAAPHAYHIADVLLDGAFLRFYPDGMAAAGIAFPVEDADALRRVVDALPAA
jgi:hypothetical protein